MGRKWYLLVIVLLVLPFTLNRYFGSRCPELPGEALRLSSAGAVPSFARQTGLSCASCHTIPPRLNTYGRLFKVRGYTDGTAMGDLSVGKGESILKNSPVTVRVFSLPYSREEGSDREILIPDELVVAFAGRVSENVGTFTAFASEEGHAFEPEIVKVTFVHDMGATIIGLVGGKTSPTGTDPFESLNLYSRMTRTKTTVWNSVLKRNTADIWDLHNYGASLYAYVGGLLYLNGGVYTGIVRDDSGVKNKDSSDPFDIYARVALTPSGLPADVNVGAFYYAGKDEPAGGNPTSLGGNTSYKPRRMGLDLGVIKSFGDISLELNGLYVDAEDSFSASPDFRHRGYNLSLILYWKYRVGISLLYGSYRYKTDNPVTSNNEEGLKRSDTTLHASYLFRPNVRLGAEYTTTRYSPGNRMYLTSLVLDLAF